MVIPAPSYSRVSISLKDAETEIAPLKENEATPDEAIIGGLKRKSMHSASPSKIRPRIGIGVELMPLRLKGGYDSSKPGSDYDTDDDYDGEVTLTSSELRANQNQAELYETAQSSDPADAWIDLIGQPIPCLGSPENTCRFDLNEHPERAAFWEKIEVEGSNFRLTNAEKMQFMSTYMNDDHELGTSAEFHIRSELNIINGIRSEYCYLSHMTDIQLLAIRVWSSNLFREILEALNRATLYPSQRGLIYAKAVVDAFHALPDTLTYQNTVWARFSAESCPDQWVHDRFKPNETYTFSQFLGASKRPGAAWLGRVELKIDALYGKDISMISTSPQEEEILFIPNSTFKTISIQENEPDEYQAALKIQLQEVPHPR